MSIKGKGKKQEKEKKKLKGKDKSKAQHLSSPLVDTIDIETHLPSMSPAYNPEVAVNASSAGRSCNSLVGGKRPQAGSSTLAGQSGSVPLKKSKTNGVSRGNGANIGIFYHNLRCCLHELM